MKQPLNEQFRRMQKLAGILNENIEGLPGWVKDIEYDEHHGDFTLIVDKNWFTTNKTQLEDNIKDYCMFYSSKVGDSLKNLPNYDPKKDYISDEGTTYIDGKHVRTNSGDNLNSRKEDVEKQIKDIFTRYLIVITDPSGKYYVKDIISNEEIEKIKKYSEDKYKKVIAIYIEGK